MKLTESENEIILIDAPIFFWIIGAVLSVLYLAFTIGFIILVYFKPVQFTFNFSDLSSLISSALNFAVMLLAFIFFAALCLSLILMAKISITVNSAKKSVEVSRIGILKKQIDRYNFNQISRFDIFPNQKTNYSQLFLILANESKIPLEIGSHQKEEAAKIVERLNSFFLQ
jgi:hypothetical protein